MMTRTTTELKGSAIILRSEGPRGGALAWDGCEGPCEALAFWAPSFYDDDAKPFACEHTRPDLTGHGERTQMALGHPDEATECRLISGQVVR